MFQNICQNENDITTVLQRDGMFLHIGDTQLPDYMTLCQQYTVRILLL